MKRVIPLALVLCLFLTACAPQAPAPTVPVDPATMMERQQDIGQNNLHRIYLPALEDLSAPRMAPFGSDLLFWSAAEDTLICKLVSAGTGAVTAEATFSTGEGAFLQILTDHIALWDPGAACFRLLDSALAEVSVLTPVAGSGTPFLSKDGSAIFRIVNGDLTATDVQSGESRLLVGDVSALRMTGADAHKLIVTYHYTESRPFYALLDLYTHRIEKLPMPTAPEVLGFGNGIYLLSGEGENSCHLFADDRHNLIFPEAGGLSLLGEKSHLLLTDPAGSLTLYTPEGHFLSSCALLENNSGTPRDILWSYLWNGYFFLVDGPDRCSLMFWDTSVHASGDPLEITPFCTLSDGSADALAVTQRAAALSETYGFRLRLGADCSLKSGNFTARALTDLDRIRRSLDILEYALAAYPPGFLKQLGSVTFDIVQDVQAVDPTVYTGFYSGYAFRLEGENYIVMDAAMDDPLLIYHELSHIIDQVLTDDAATRAEALFGEHHWMALQPEGFSYAGGYTDIPASLLAYMDSGFFVRAYSLTAPTEDRATFMEAAMKGDRAVFAENPGLAAKLDYYARCIRDCFDTTGWPEKAPWEVVLPETAPEAP